MTDITKYAPRLSDYTLVVAAGTFVFWRIAYSNHAFDLHRCPGEMNVLGRIRGTTWFLALLLSISSVVLGIAALKLGAALKGLVAVAIVFLNFSNLPGSGGMRADSTAVASLRTIHTAEATYLSNSGGRYGSIPDLIETTLLDIRFEGAPLGNYIYEVAVFNDGYLAIARPVGPRSPARGCWEYYSTEDGVVLYSKNPQKAPRGQAGMPLE